MLPNRRHLAENRAGPLYGGRRRRLFLPWHRRVRFVRERHRRAPLAALALLATVLGLAAAIAFAAPSSHVRGSFDPPDPTQTVLGPAAPPGPDATYAPAFPQVHFRRSHALGRWFARGRLRNGVQLPTEGEDFLTWDPVLKESPNRGWRRWGTDRLVRMLLRVARQYRAAHPGAPRLLIGDLSRPHGGHFGAEFGGLGHASHQNGLDVDVYYPRRDRRELRPFRPGQVDRALAQELVNRFVRAGAIKAFVGPHVGLTGPPGIVSPLVYHDDHVHVRIR